jgi:hypothetical protein
MNRERILTITFSLAIIMLIPGIYIPEVRGANIKGIFKEVYGLNDSGIGSNQEPTKVKLIDKGHFYFLNTGEKKSFLIEENAYFIIYKHGTSPTIPQEELQNRFTRDFDIISEHRLKKLVKFKIRQGRNKKNIISALYRADPSIHFISPALTTKDKRGELAVTPGIIVRIDKNADPVYAMVEIHKYGLSLLSKRPMTDYEFEMKVDGPVDGISRIFEIARTLAKLPFIEWAEPDFMISSKRHFISPFIEWAEPDFMISSKRHFISNDPMFSDQWHLHSTGQNGAAVDADVDAPEGWDVAQGNGAVIAVYDDGVDTLHEDLNIWSNPGETGGGKETNGIDDDGNGFIDDYQGWDFSDDDNDPSPEDKNGPAITALG